MVYADDAGIASKSAAGLAKMMTVVVTVFEAAGRTVSEKRTETMLLRTPDHVIPGPIARHRSSWSEVQTDDPVLISGRRYPRKCSPLARNRTADPSHAGMPQTLWPGVV